MNTKMQREEETRINTFQEALEKEEHKLAVELFNVRRSLQNLQGCRRALLTMKPQPTSGRRAVADETRS